ncbi:MAG TPA: hypothetical protein VLI41_07860 [Phenylobacterium sp.]|uniref:hypothetical protein n=1 Tax=Phenylobacterium sp. TaxID=1871053 RepID=UPI002B5F86A3|nr:hypothetical protein [Phenylobacterium sp.]HSV03109.1 hypothetical protein [Phenylobacterium sp.]
MGDTVASEQIWNNGVRLARCGRQSMALEARFVRDAQRAAREAVEELKTERQARVDARKRRSTTG